MLRETLESWLLFFGRETHAYCVGDGASHGGNWPPLRGHDAQLGVMATYYPPGVAGKRRIVADTARVEAGCP